MPDITAQQIKDFLLTKYHSSLQQFSTIPDDFDLLTEGIIDSLGVLDMISSIEEHFNIEIDFEEIDADDLTVIGPLCNFIESKIPNQ